MSVFQNEGNVGHQVGHQIINGNFYSYTNVSNPANPDKRQRLGRISSEETLDDAILASLVFPQMSDRRRNIEHPYHRTCQWLFKLEEYQKWRHQSSGLLWIKGKPGAGKSTLMSYLYRALFLREQHTPDSAEIYLEFFFTARGTPLERMFLGMLRSLLSQIFHRDHSVRALLRTPYQEKEASFGFTTWTWQQSELQELLMDMLLASAQQQTVTVLIDALDEAGEQSAGDIARYFHILNHRCREQEGRIKICISCRHYPIPPSVRTAFEIHVEKHNREDITLYIRDYAENYISIDGTPFVTDREEWDTLLSTVADMANGIFQWAHLIMPLLGKRIGDGDSVHRVKIWLSQVSTELQQVYEYIVTHVIEREYSVNSLRLFQWVCLAIRPLSVLELRYALAAHNIEPGPPPHPTCPEVSGFIPTHDVMRRRVQSWSGGLLEVVDQGSDRVPIVQPIHLSVTTFMVTRGLNYLLNSAEDDAANNSVSTTHVDGKISRTSSAYHGELYWSCVKYIAAEKENLSFLAVDATNDIILLRDTKLRGLWKDKQDNFPFLAYAASNVFVHAEQAQEHRDQDLAQETQLLTYIMPTWTNAIAACDLQEFVGFHQGTTPLHIAAAYNLIDLGKHLVESGVDILTPNGRSWSPLHFACFHGHLAMVQILVGAGADIHDGSDDIGKPLALAALRGRADIFTWILNHESELEMQDSKITAAFNVAVAGGQTAVVKLCIRAGVKVDAQGADFIDAFHEAASYGHKETVQALLDVGVDVNAKGADYGTALTAAASYAREEVIHILLAAGADVNAQGGRHSNALRAAVSSGDKEVVKLLVRVGADVNAQGDDFTTALQVAASKSHTDIVRVLLHAGANPNAQGGWPGSALQAASQEDSRESIVQMLFDAGADVNAHGGHYGNALQAASFNGAVTVAQMLIDAGADVTASGGHYGNALQAASSSGSVSIVRMLLDAGADVNMLGGHFGCALQAGSFSRMSDEITEILLGAGADVNVRGGYHGSALQSAASRGNQKTVEILLGAGADVNAEGGYYGSALQAAVATNDGLIVRVLLAAGANVNIRAGDRGNALQIALKYGYEEIIIWLKQAGAELPTNQTDNC